MLPPQSRQIQFLFACAIVSIFCTTIAHGADLIINFDDVPLASQSFQNAGFFGSSGAFNFQGVTFPYNYDSMFDFSDGWAISNQTDTATAGAGNQYSSYTGGGASPHNFAIGTPNFVTGLTIGIPRGYNPASVDLTNNTYAALSMKNGDFFAKKFGGDSGNDPDYFRTTISGINGLSQTVGSVCFYLADYRFDDNSLDYILNQWKAVALSQLAGASTLSFSFASSDVGMFGINTPLYLALDNFALNVIPASAGDLNFDGSVTVADISLLMNALTNLQGFELAHNLTDEQLKTIVDVNDDGFMNNVDIQSLITDVANNMPVQLAVTPVPEPSALVLAIGGIVVGCIAARRFNGNAVRLSIPIVSYGRRV